MPQSFRLIVPNPELYLSADVLADKPEMAILVGRIFATYALLEGELSLLLVRILGANAAAALAIFAELRTQNLQTVALRAAAEAILPAESFKVFTATLAAVKSAETDRHRLAHWAWGGCRQRPDLLALADPDVLREQYFQLTKHYESTEPNPIVDILKGLELYRLNPDHVLAYSKDDLDRALRNLSEAHDVVLHFRAYLDPLFKGSVVRLLVPKELDADALRAEALRLLNAKRLFREAFERATMTESKAQPMKPESPPQEPGAK